LARDDKYLANPHVRDGGGGDDRIVILPSNFETIPSATWSGYLGVIHPSLD
jgi:hypothetical protein